MLNRILAAVMKLRGRLVYKMSTLGAPASEIAKSTNLSEEEVERIIWWHRSQAGEVNGGWLS